MRSAVSVAYDSGAIVSEAPGRPTGVTGTVTLRPEASGTRVIGEPDTRAGLRRGVAYRNGPT